MPVCQQGISAVKAIGLAASQGQKIYTITKEVYANNPNIVSSQLYALSQATQQAVQNALDIGHEVTIHEKPITHSGWTGAGYTAIDPDTGAGGYMIDGGSNGGVLLLDILKNMLIALAFFAALVAIPIGIAGAALGSSLAVAAAAIGFIAAITYSLLTGDGLFLAGLRLILVSIAFVVLAPAAGVTAAIGGTLALMWVLAVAGFYFALAQLASLTSPKSLGVRYA